MLNRLRLFIAVICAAVCSVANALQPISRAGSISMNTGVKPTSTTVTSTTATPAASGNININTNRGSAAKFAPKVVTVAGNTNNNPGSGVSSQDLQDLQNQINDLIDAQRNQVTREYVEETVENNISRLDVPAIKTTVSNIQSTTQNLSESVNTIQQRTNDYENTLSQDVDNRLKVRGLIDNNNQIPFAKKSDIEPATLAQNIVANTTATATLVEKIQPKENEIREIITDELTDVGVLKYDGTLDVEKKGQVQITETTVTEALRNSQNFKTMVSDEVSTKGYVTETALADHDFVTNTALNAKNFVASDSDTFRNLATKSEIAPDTLAAAIANNVTARETLSGKIGPDENSVKNLIVSDLKQRGIIDDAENLAIATDAHVSEISGNITTLSSQIETLLDEDENTTGSIANKLKTAGFVKESDITAEKLGEKLDTKYASKTLESTVANLDGDITNQNSLLYKIKNNSEIRTALKGDKGEAGSGFSFKGNVSSTSDLTQCTTDTQSHAYYNTTDELLYICSCTDNTCEYDGVPFKGEKGDPGESAKSVQQQYCEENLDIVKALYSSVTQLSDCANATKFSYAQYSAIMGGARAYCLSLTQNTLDLTSGIGKKLVATFGSDKMTAFNSASTPQSRMQLTGFKASASKTNTTFMEACENRYNEIMSGDDGENAETAWHAWCAAKNDNDSSVTNLNAIIIPLYGDNKTCDNFTSAEYNAIQGGARAYCLSLATNPTKLDTDNGIGKKLEAALGTGTVKSLKDTTNLKSRMLLKNFGESKNLDFVTACEEKYNAIMSGDDGSDGKSAAETWCEAHLMKNNTVSVRLSPAKMTRAYDKIKGISAYAGKIEIGSTSGEGGYFTDMNACLAAVAADPDLMGGESEADQKFNELQKETIQKGSFTLSGATSALSTHRASFRDTYLKGQNGQDGTTFTPSFNSTTGQLSWTSSKSGVAAPSTMKIAKTDSEMNTLIDTKTNNAIGSQAVTMNDLVNYINAGLFKVGENAVTLNTNFTTSGLSSGETVSLQKLSGAGNSSDSTKRIGTVSSGTCSGGVCSVEKSAAIETNTDYNYPITPLFNQP